MLPALKTPDHDLIARFALLAGDGGAIVDPSGQAKYLREWRDRYVGRTPIVLRPSNTAQVSEILALANAERIGIVPQGGNTGLVGGQIPFEKGTEIVLSLERMNRVRDADAAGNCIAADAGATLKSIQDAAADIDRLFPLSLGSEGTCQIGGNLATNAGGIHVLRYGNTRDLALGIEAVFADGRVWNGLKKLRKDNTGYDLKNLLIGSEGTLAVITAATLKLFSQPKEVSTVWAGVPNLNAAGALFTRAFEQAGPLLTAFELMPRILIDFSLKHFSGARDPLGERHPWYVLFEISSPLAEGIAERVTMALLEAALEDGVVTDAAIAASESQAQSFWSMREGMPDVQKHEGGSIKHDISVPVSSIPRFIEEASAAVEKLVPGARPVPFGHFGDGNIHFNITQPAAMEKAAFLARWDDVAHAVHAIVLRMNGSISAEHGIGRMKAAAMDGIKSPVEMDAMRGIKLALDPNGILNPGKLFTRL